MSISTQAEWNGMQEIATAVAVTLEKMRNHARVGMSTKELDEYGGNLLRSMGANSAPAVTYGFPGFTCISVNNEIAHGIPSATRILQEGDLVNIDVSAEKNGFWADNGGSFVLGADLHQHEALVTASKNILKKAISRIRHNTRISAIGKLIESEAAKAGFTVIRNLAGHGTGRKLHEDPQDILNCYDRYNRESFQKNSVVAIETFISTRSSLAREGKDGWTLTGNKGGFVAQHEHTIVVTDDEPIILTHLNGIWN